jgi:hypothetical protein
MIGFRIAGAVGALALLLVGSRPAAGGEDAWATLGPAEIGALRSEIAQTLALDCRATVCVPAAGALPDMRGLPVRKLELEFAGERLARVRVELGEPHYAAMLQALRGEYGPGSDHSFQARAGMAGEFSAGLTVWAGPRLAIVLEQYAGKIDRSRLTYGTPAAMDELVRTKSAIPPGARRDL